MKLELTPKDGLKKRDESHKRKKNPKSSKGGKRPSRDSDSVTEVLDGAVVWDDIEQKWRSSIIMTFVNTDGSKRVRVFERLTPDFPDDMDVPNTVNSSDNEDKTETHSITFYDDIEDLSAKSSPTGSGSSQGIQTMNVMVYGHALGSALVETAHDKVYDWKSNCYALHTPGGKPTTVAFPGALLSGAQLNVLTGTSRYDTSRLYEVTKCEGVSWKYGDKFTDQDIKYTNATDFINRNKGTGKPAEWTSGTVAVDLQTKVIDEESRAKFFRDAFNSREDDDVLSQHGYDPLQWKEVFTQSEQELIGLFKQMYPGISDENAIAMMAMSNNPGKLAAMYQSPESLKIVGALGLSNSLQNRVDWLWALTHSR